MPTPDLSQPKRHLHEVAYLTADLPGVGGVIKQRPTDFMVDEQPQYSTCGEGEHLYLFIEKTTLATTDAIRRIAKAFRVPRSDIGYAGLKDKHAVARQHISIHLPTPDTDFEHQSVQRAEYHPGIKILWTDRHTNKLRLGHLRGNRFVIYIREVQPTAVLNAKRVFDELIHRGMANFFGEQRFGYRANSHRIGRSLLLGDYRGVLDQLLGQPDDREVALRRQGRAAYESGDFDTALERCPKGLRFEKQALDALRQGKTHEQAVHTIDRTQRELMLSAWQSSLFNEVLTRRLAEGTFDRLIAGDLAQKHDNRAVFAVDEAIAETENAPGGRIEQFEISPSGPMWGPQMTQASGSIGQLEQSVLEADGLTLDNLSPPAKLKLVGQRRPLRVPLIDPDISGGVDEHGSYIRVAFELSRGSFATVALREIMKNTTAT